MQLFGKQSCRCSIRQVTDALASSFAACPSVDLSTARRWLIALGKLEQALLDAGHPGAAAAMSLTRSAAVVFLDARGSGRSRNGARMLLNLLHTSHALAEDAEIDMRIPEGFAWYALYPEAYADTAERWARSYPAASVDIIGLRSIGTTLAAVVAETLHRAGLRVLRCSTIRPFGHPFARVGEIPWIHGADFHIIVDEGPGLSGSSMVAAAMSLVAMGAPSDSIFFFAGHANGPGSVAGDEIRKWWTTERVWSTQFPNSRLSDMPLAARVEEWTGTKVLSISQLDTADWAREAHLTSLPRAAMPNLETPKRLVRLCDGRAVVLKFAGLVPRLPDLRSADEMDWARLCVLADRRWTPRPVGAAHGWIALPWIDGTNLTAEDTSPQFIEEVLVPYLAVAAVPMRRDPRLAIERMRTALIAWASERACRNALEAIGRSIAREIARLQAGSKPALGYGDGRLAPHEWVRQADESIMKLDAGGHDSDHTWVGEQSLAWDIAGAAVEWELDSFQTQLLAASVASRTDTSFDQGTLTLHVAAYCAFKTAAAHHCNRASEADDYEKRLKLAIGDIGQASS